MCCRFSGDRQTPRGSQHCVKTNRIHVQLAVKRWKQTTEESAALGITGLSEAKLCRRSALGGSRIISTQSSAQVLPPLLGSTGQRHRIAAFWWSWFESFVPADYSSCRIVCVLIVCNCPWCSLSPSPGPTRAVSAAFGHSLRALHPTRWGHSFGQIFIKLGFTLIFLTLNWFSFPFFRGSAWVKSVWPHDKMSHCLGNFTCNEFKFSLQYSPAPPNIVSRKTEPWNLSMKKKRKKRRRLKTLNTTSFSFFGTGVIWNQSMHLMNISDSCPEATHNPI